MSLRFAANVSMLFADVPVPERFARAARAGFDGVEIQFPYAWPAAELAAALAASGLPMVLHNLPAGGPGERGIGCHPGRIDAFRAGVATGIAYAQALGVGQLNALAGVAPAGVDDALLRRTFVANLRFAAPRLADAGIRLLIEPINRLDAPGFWLDTPAKGFAVIDEAGCDNLFLQYDVYHAQRSEGELAATLERNAGRIAHIQIADNPGRHEPGSGEIGWDFVFAHLRRIGWGGWIGCEYVPATTTEAGLGWLARARAAAA